jgi:Sec-independent protein translocase protein (TatC)
MPAGGASAWHRPVLPGTQHAYFGEGKCYQTYVEHGLGTAWNRSPQHSLCCLLWQVPVVQILLGQFGLVSSQQFFAQWRYVIVGATAAAAVLTPSTDPFTQTLLAIPLIGLYLGGASAVRLLEQTKAKEA